MTSAERRPVRFMPRSGIGRSRYEIAVSSPLLYQAFADGAHRPNSVARKVCRDRLEALQRIFEHELIHLVETLGSHTSSCSGQRFQSIAYRFFGHTQHTHRLITPQERAKVQFQLGPGTSVRFRLDGQEYTGIVNRVTKRATVLVPDARDRVLGRSTLRQVLRSASFAGSPQQRQTAVKGYYSGMEVPRGRVALLGIGRGRQSARPSTIPSSAPDGQTQ